MRSTAICWLHERDLVGVEPVALDSTCVGELLLAHLRERPSWVASATTARRAARTVLITSAFCLRMRCWKDERLEQVLKAGGVEHDA